MKIPFAENLKKLRRAKDMTQDDLAQFLGVTFQAVSKWETGKGLPDITLIEPLSQALGVSVMELMSGDTVINKNRSGNILRSKFYVCPLCGNIIRTCGDTPFAMYHSFTGEDFTPQHFAMALD